MDMKVKQTAEGLYYNANDVEELVRLFCHTYPSNSLYVLWTTLRKARREYNEATSYHRKRSDRAGCTGHLPPKHDV